MLSITPADFISRMEAHGFIVEENAQVDETLYLDVTHPNEEGIVMEVVISEDEVENVERRVDDGPERELRHQYPTLDGLSPEQIDHLYNIDFGTYFPEAESFDRFEQLLQLIEKNIKVNPVL